MALQILLWLGLSFLVVIILFLILPIHVVLSWQSDPAKQSTVLLRLFGGVFPTIRVYDSSKPPLAKKLVRKNRKRRGKTRKRGWNARGDLLPEVLVLARRVLGAIHIDVLRLDAEVGLGDPAETGQLYGQLCPLIYTTAEHFILRPNFEKACFQGSAMAQIRFTILGLIWPFARFGWRMFGPAR